MADDEPILASAVVVPELYDEPASPSRSVHKRRHTSDPEADTKRPRLSTNGADNGSPDDLREDRHSPTDSRAERRRSGALEDRKRGQRLFGALLGTLSQSSSTATQRRRADIDKKQQEKLKRQTQELEERKQQRLKESIASMRRQQERFDRQTLRIHHANTLAQAHFLQTKAEPKLYYKPWELRPEEEDTIKAQVVQVEADIELELGELKRQKQDERHAEHKEELPGTPKVVSKEEDAEARKNEDMVGSEQGNEPPKSPEKHHDATTNQIDTVSHQDHRVDERSTKEHDAKSKEHHDDHGEEVLEADEDTVIY